MHDAVIIGAGPGGSSTAHFLSRRGLDVLLLDRADFPRDKTCGDGLTPRALRVLDQMGILAEVERKGCRVGAYEVVAPERSGHVGRYHRGARGAGRPPPRPGRNRLAARRGQWRVRSPAG